jgi:hypothetical protein
VEATSLIATVGGIAELAKDALQSQAVQRAATPRRTDGG